jgi:hypothetical protein
MQCKANTLTHMHRVVSMPSGHAARPAVLCCAAADVPGVRLSGVLPQRTCRAGMAAGCQPSMPGECTQPMLLLKPAVVTACLPKLLL